MEVFPHCIITYRLASNYAMITCLTNSGKAAKFHTHFYSSLAIIVRKPEIIHNTHLKGCFEWMKRLNGASTFKYGSHCY